MKITKPPTLARMLSAIVRDRKLESLATGVDFATEHAMPQDVIDDLRRWRAVSLAALQACSRLHHNFYVSVWLSEENRVILLKHEVRAEIRLRSGPNAIARRVFAPPFREEYVVGACKTLLRDTRSLAARIEHGGRVYLPGCEGPMPEQRRRDWVLSCEKLMADLASVDMVRELQEQA